MIGEADLAGLYYSKYFLKNQLCKKGPSGYVIEK